MAYLEPHQGITRHNKNKKVQVIPLCRQMVMILREHQQIRGGAVEDYFFCNECGGNAFALQKLLGHSTLKMAKHYCNIFDTDIAKNFDECSPLAQIKASRQAIRR